MPALRPLSRLLALLALPLALAACDSNSDEEVKGCYGRSGGTPQCLVVVETVEGTGMAAAPNDSVFVRYVGRTKSNNAEFDRGAFGFPLREGEVIAGFYYAIGGSTVGDRSLTGLTTTFGPMKVGGKRTATIPAELAYGGQEIRNSQGFVLIPKNSDLIFEIELTNVKKQ